MMSVELTEIKQSAASYFGGQNLAYAFELEKKGILFASGSRYFANISKKIQITPSTDYDFYMQYNDANLELIKNFDCSVRYTYDPRYPFDDLAVAIVTLSNDNAQIIIRSDAALYGKVQQSILGDFYHDYLWKSGPNKPQREQIMRIYNQLFITARQMR